jgi:hypothetical protein
VFLPNPGTGEFPREQTHLKGQDYALFPGHRAENLILNGLRRGTRIADGHRKMLSQMGAAQCFADELTGRRIGHFATPEST